MPKKPKTPLTNSGGEVRELLSQDMKRLRPASDSLPPALLDALPKRKRGERGRQKAPTKAQITLRVDKDVLRFFRSAGPGWQTRINRVLRNAMRDAG